MSSWRSRDASPRRRATTGSAVLLAALLAVGAASVARGAGAAKVDKTTTEANITRLTTALLAGSQFAHHPLDEQLAGKLLDRYLEALDGSRLLFLQSDVAEFDAYRAKLAYATRVEGDTRAAHTIFTRYLLRLGQQVAFATERLRSDPFDFTAHDVFTFDRKRVARPRDLAGARDVWRQELRAEFLQEAMGDKKPMHDEIVKTLTRRHVQQLRTMKALGEDAVLEVYLDALTHVYDPHSDYLGHEEMESLSIAMNLSLFGIGASLTSEDGVCTIRELIPGSPAAKSGMLKPGERIVAVAQGNSDSVDVTDMPLGKIVELIRGPKGSAVTLTVLPPAGATDAPHTVQLVRAEIKLEDQQAKARIIDVKDQDGGTVRLGVVDLPSFYSGEGGRGRGPSGATADVKKLLTKLQAEHVRGIVLDLRRNGGGSLDEAISLSGLFVKSGPIVQTRDSKNVIEVAADPDPGVLYDGPLVVLTSKFSASASEIAAGALQDYGRAVIVGDSTTFGKGTVQTVLPLAALMDRAGLGHSYDPGALKITVSKFYRPTGASTELHGVASDIVLPSRSEVSGVGESELKDPLPWDTVPAAPFERKDRVGPYLAALQERSAKRIAADGPFSELRQEVAQLKQKLASGKISLNEAERRRELAATKLHEKAIEEEARLQSGKWTTYQLTLKDTAVPGLPARLIVASRPAPSPDAGAADEHKRDSNEHTPDDELILHEALMILGDYTRRAGASPAPGARTRR